VLNEADFYEGYRQRLEKKLNQKIMQITRDERLLETIPEDERATFRASLQMAINERDEIQRLLDELNVRIQSTSKLE
jgi:hypothetical protein